MTTKTAAKKRPDVKHRISGRAEALEQLGQILASMATLPETSIDATVMDVPRRVFDRYQGAEYYSDDDGDRTWWRTITLLEFATHWDTGDGGWRPGAGFIHWRGVELRLHTSEPPEGGAG